MADNSKIEWCKATWNPIRARVKENMAIRGRDVPAGKMGYHCERISPGCVNCYASTMNGRMLPAWGTGLDFTVPNREKVEMFLDETELLKPLKWKKPRRIFVESMSDWCATFVTDEMRDRILAVAALCPQHTFLFLTKRADRCAECFDKLTPERIDDSIAPLANTRQEFQWPLPNVHIGFSAENQECFDARWAHMHQLAAAGWKVWCSAEPLLGPIDMRHALNASLVTPLVQVVVGGESGHGARPMNIEWVRSIVRQCRDAEVACFVKQMGAKPVVEYSEQSLWPAATRWGWHAESHHWRIGLKDKKGGKPPEWPEDLRVRQFPEAR